MAKTQEVELEDQDFKDLKPQNKRKRKEPPKPWGKTERLIVLSCLLITVLTASLLSLSARNWKLPNMPKIKFPNNGGVNPFKETVVVVGNSGSGIDQQKISDIKKNFRDLTDQYSGIYAFYIYDLNGNYFYGENYQEVLTAASLIKLPVMELAFKKLEAGELEEDETLPLLEAMGKRSDNNAFLKMLDILGRDKVEMEIKEIGMNSTSLKDNTTTPEDVGMFFKKLYNRQFLSEKYTDLFFEYLTDTIYEDWLRPGIPSDIPVAHKYGRETHSISDGGVIFSDKPFVMVIMTDGIIDEEANEIFPKLSNMLYNGHISE